MSQWRAGVTAVAALVLLTPSSAPTAAARDPRIACEQAVFASPAFTRFLLANPSLRTLNREGQKEAYVLRGALAMQEVGLAASRTAYETGFIEDKPSDEADLAISYDDTNLPDDFDVTALALPVDHPFDVVKRLINARIILAAKDGKRVTPDLRQLLVESRRRWGADSPRLLPILLVLSDGLRKEALADEAAVADSEFLRIAMSRPKLARPLSMSIQTVSTRLAEHYEHLSIALEVDGISGGEKQIGNARAEAARLRKQAETFRQRSAYSIENLVPLLIGSLPGGTSMSLAQATTSPSLPRQGANSLATIVNSTLSLMVAVSDDSAANVESFGPARAVKDRAPALGRCLVESGKAFVAWDTSAGLRNFRTALDQVDSQSVADLIRKRYNTSDEYDAPEATDLLAIEEDDVPWLGFSLGGFVATYASGDMTRLADVLDRAMGDAVFKEIGKSLAKSAEGDEEQEEALAKFLPYAGGLAQKLRPVVTNMLREPSPKTIRDAEALRGWLDSNQRPFRITLANFLAKQIDEDDSDKDEIIAGALGTYDWVFPLVTSLSDGFVVKAAIANNDLPAATRANAIAVKRIGGYLARKNPSAEIQRAQAQLLSGTPGSSEYDAASRVFASAMLAAVQKDLYQTTGLDVLGQLADAADRDELLDTSIDSDHPLAAAEVRQAVEAVGGDFLWGVSPSRPVNADAMAALVAYAMKSMGDSKPDVEFRKALNPTGLEPFTEITTSNVVNAMSGFEPLLERSLYVATVHLAALKRSGHKKEAAFMGDLVAAGVDWWSAVPPKTRLSYGAIVPEAVYRYAVEWLILYDRPHEAEAVAGFWVEARKSVYAIPRTTVAAQMRAWRQDRQAWSIQAWLATSRIQRMTSPSTQDIDVVLNAMDGANRNVAGADFSARLQAAQLSAPVRQAYFDWSQKSQGLEAASLSATVNAQRDLNLTGSAMALSVGGGELDMLRAAEEQAWTRYQTALRGAGVVEKAVGYRALQASLTPEEVLLTGLVLNNQVIMLAMAPDKAPKIVTAPISYDQLRRLVAVYKGDMTLSVSGGAPRTFNRANAAELWRVIGAPAQDYLKAGQRLVWVPPRELSDFPITALPVAGLGESGWLGIDRQIMVSPSLESFLSMRSMKAVAPSNRVLAVGDIVFRGQQRGGQVDFDLNYTLPPTPGARSALDQIAGAASGGDKVILRDQNATKSKLLGMRGQAFDVALFYTHGVAGRLGVQCGRPVAQALALYQTRSCGEALLSTDEAAALRLKARVVVLAACATAAAPDDTLGPLGGMTRAFLLGGADSVIAAHMPVADRAASRFAPIVVEELAGRRRGASQALQITLARLRAQKDLESPAYWGQFEVVGEGAPPAGPPKPPGLKV